MNQQIISLNRAEPRYRQVKSHILKLIGDGELQANDRVPSENELVGTLGVSRMTVNRALRELADDGFVVRLAGVGTFVADSRPHSDVMMVRNIAENWQTTVLSSDSLESVHLLPIPARILM